MESMRGLFVFKLLSLSFAAIAGNVKDCDNSVYSPAQRRSSAYSAEPPFPDVPLTAREYGPTAPDYGQPGIETAPPLPPSYTFDSPPHDSYFGPPAHGFHPEGPPRSPLPPYGPPFGPNPYEVIHTRLYPLFEVSVVLVVGTIIFVSVRHYVIPYLIYFARSLEEEEEERSLREHGLDRTTVNILRAVTKGVCLERISCQLGEKAKAYTLTNAVIGAIQDYENEEKLPLLATIFRDAALGRVDSCAPYICDRQLHNSTTVKTTKSNQLARSRRKRNTTKD